MAVDLSDQEYIDSLKRAVTPLGGTTPDVADDVWLGYLTDAFWLARLDGFMLGYSADSTGVVTNPSGDDLPQQYIALIVLYAAIRSMQLQILNSAPAFRAKAGPVEYEQQAASASVLTEMLKQLRATQQRIIDELVGVGTSPTLYLDALSVRTFSWPSYWGSIELTG